MNFSLPKIYPITDRLLSGRSHTVQVKELISGGAKLVQLREKSSNMREFCEDAAEAVRVGKASGTAVIINDRVDIALVTGADGVHLGQDDLPVTEARRLLGPDAIIGLSTHNLDQVEQARRLPVDYVAFGPIFETATKADHEPVTGARQLRNIRKAVDDIPLVAIGGITPENLISVLENGANSAAMISGLYRSADGIRAAFRRLYEIAELKNIVSRG